MRNFSSEKVIKKPIKAILNNLNKLNIKQTNKQKCGLLIKAAGIRLFFGLSPTNFHFIFINMVLKNKNEYFFF